MANYTTMSLDAIKLLCSVINKTVDLPNTIISDTSIATNTTHSSYKIKLDMDNLETELKNYMDTAIAGMNKLTKEIINDKALVVKDNVLYLYKYSLVCLFYQQKKHPKPNALVNLIIS